MASKQLTLLSLLRARSTVDCDTLDSDIATSLGPFEDCTCNQAIALAELSLHRHKALLEQAASLAKEYAKHYADVPLPALAVEIATILLALRIAPHLHSYSHVQVNPLHAYSTSQTVTSAIRLRSLLERISPPAASRLCVKIPSTWEGLRACYILEHDHNIRTLATTLFTIEQAVVAAKAGCRYVAPYVNELKVHFEIGYVDPAPAVELCRDIQAWYEKVGANTMVLAASLTSVTEVMALAGVKHITIAPKLLSELAEITLQESELSAKYPTVFDVENRNARHAQAGKAQAEEYKELEDEASYRMAITRSNAGRDEGKLVQAINIFFDCQVKLEALMAGVLEAL